MSTWISKPLAASGICLLLQACVPGGGAPGLGWLDLGGLSVSGATEIDVMDGAVTVAGPDGYCVDRRASRPGAIAPFVLLAPCADTANTDQVPAVLTATVTKGRGPTAAGYERFFSEAEGLQALSSSGNGDAVTVEQMGASADGSFRLRVSERPGPSRATAQEQLSWRAFFSVGDHLVAVSLRSTPQAFLSTDQANALLGDMVAVIQSASAKTENAEVTRSAPAFD